MQFDEISELNTAPLSASAADDAYDAVTRKVGEPVKVLGMDARQMFIAQIVLGPPKALDH